ncbi:MAG: hypothetical protein ACLUVB_05945 [Acutalibacteraceae bacterium]
MSITMTAQPWRRDLQSGSERGDQAFGWRGHLTAPGFVLLLTLPGVSVIASARRICSPYSAAEHAGCGRQADSKGAIAFSAAFLVTTVFSVSSTLSSTRTFPALPRASVLRLPWAR